MRIATEINALLCTLKTKLTAFIELGSTIRAYCELSCQAGEIFPNSAALNGSESGGGLFPR